MSTPTPPREGPYARGSEKSHDANRDPARATQPGNEVDAGAPRPPTRHDPHAAGTEDFLPATPLADAASFARIGGATPLPPPAQVELETAPRLRVAPDVTDERGRDETPITGKATLVVRRMLRSKGAVIGLVMLAVAVAFALFGNVGNPYSYSDQDLLNLGNPPGVDGHRLGTDPGGIDLWAMLVRGTGKSLLIAALVGIVAPIIAAVYGTAIAFWGGTRERIGMWVLDMLILMPYFLIVAVFMGSTGGNALHLALLLTLFGWMGMARVVRATTQSLRDREFVQAARYLGVSDWDIIRRHIIPNLGSYLVLNIVLGTFGAIIAETALSFLGVGVRPPDVSLGQLIGQSASQLSAYPWLFWGPVLCLQWITLALSLVGDGLRDALDPTSSAGARA